MIVFGLIKRSIKKTDRIYNLKDYVSLLANASNKIKEVVVIQGEDIFDFNGWWPPLYKKQTLSDESYSSTVPRKEK